MAVHDGIGPDCGVGIETGGKMLLIAEVEENGVLWPRVELVGATKDIEKAFQS